MKPSLNKAGKSSTDKVSATSPPPPPSIKEVLTRDRVVIETAQPAKSVDVQAAAILGKSQSLRAFKASLGWK